MSPLPEVSQAEGGERYHPTCASCPHKDLGDGGWWNPGPLPTLLTLLLGPSLCTLPPSFLYLPSRA